MYSLELVEGLKKNAGDIDGVTDGAWDCFNKARKYEETDANLSIKNYSLAILLKHDFYAAISALLNLKLKVGKIDSLVNSLAFFIVDNKIMFSISNYVEAVIILIENNNPVLYKETKNIYLFEVVNAFLKMVTDFIQQSKDSHSKDFILGYDTDDTHHPLIDFSILDEYFNEKVNRDDMKLIGDIEKSLCKCAFKRIKPFIVNKNFLDNSSKVVMVSNATFLSAKIWQFFRSLILQDKSINVIKTGIDQRVNNKWPHEASLIVRPGNVEINSLISYFIDPNEVNFTALKIAQEELLKVFNPSISEISWWPRVNAYENMKILRTNAGWYPSFESGGGFKEWADLYLSSFKSSGASVILSHTETCFPMITLLNDFNVSNRLLKFSNDGFCNYINNENVLFISQYNEEITEQWCNGRLQKFWEDVGFNIDLKSLTVIPGPMSIFPNRPSDSWESSFLSLCNKIDRLVEEKEITVFIISSGCYGPPVADYVYKKYNIKSVSIGHISNAFFSVYTKSFDSFRDNLAMTNYWVTSNIQKKYKTLKNIDGGRYC